MKILKIIHGYPHEYNAGSEVYSQSICNELIKYHEVILFSREENEYTPDFSFRESITAHGIRHIVVNMSRGKDGYNHPKLNQKFSQLIDKIKPDIAHIGHLNHLSIGIVDVLHENKIPIVCTLHDFWLMCPRGQFLQRNFDGENLFMLCEKQENWECAKSCYSMYFSNYEISFDQSLFYEFSHSEHIGKDKLSDLEHWTNWIDARMFAMKQICEKIDLFVAPSKYLMNRFINDFRLPVSKIVYLDYGFPTHYLQPVIPKENGIYTFGYIGTHVPAKGINLLIEAFRKVTGNTKLKIFGREQGQNTLALKKMSQDCKNEIEFSGEYINENLATTVFNHVNCIVVPSIWAENSPLVIHEAQSCRIPVITADFGGMAEYVNDHVNGLLFKHRDENDLAAKLQYAIEHPQLMKQLGNRGYLFSEDGSVPQISQHCESLTKIYQQLIRENHENRILANHA